MSKNKNTINDQVWLDIINGTVSPDPNDQEALQIKKIRDILIDKCIKEKEPVDIEITPEQETQYEEERNRLLALLKKQKLI